MARPDPPDGSDRPLRDRKTRDRALILPLVGLILLMPPFASIFRIDGTVGGVPITLVYVFAVWVVLIAGAATLSRRLRAGLDAPEHFAEAREDEA